MVSEYVKALTGVDNEQINAIYNAVEAQMLYRLRELDVTEVPAPLAHIVDEVTIARYNYVGSEGMKVESIEGQRNEYTPVSISDYEEEIGAYISAETDIEKPKRNVVRFL